MHRSYQEMFDRIESNSGLIFVNTFEETKLIRELTKQFSDHTVEFWSATQGLHRLNNEDKPVTPHNYQSANARKADKGGSSVGNIITALDIIEADCHTKLTDDIEDFKRTAYVLRDADKFFNNPMVIRKLRDIVYLCSTAGSPILISGPALSVPTELEKDSAYIELGLPTREEIKDSIVTKSIGGLIRLHNREVVNDVDKISEEYDINRITNACMGLTEDEIFNACNYSLETQQALVEEIIINEKKNIINKNDILEFWPCEGGLSSVGGFKNFKDWFKVQKAIMDNPDVAKEFHAEHPKGCMLLGVQGSGKTAIAKAAAKESGMSVIKFDTGRVFAGLVGESEKRMRLALAQAEAAGGIVIIDEIDKSLAGAGSSDKTDGGTTKRVIGTLLTWMQEPHPGVFIIATANDITSIRNAHPELLRKGRFDNIFFSDIPSEEERAEIFEIHLKKRGRDSKRFDLKALAKLKHTDDKTKKVYHYTGAEIEHSIREAVQYNLAHSLNNGNINVKIDSKEDITTEDVKARLVEVVPIVKIGAKHIETMRTWAVDNATNVSSTPVTKKKIVKNKTSKINLTNMDFDLD